MENVSYPGKHTVVHSAGYMHTVPTSPKTMPKHEKILMKKLSTESPWPPGIRRRLIRAVEIGGQARRVGLVRKRQRTACGNRRRTT